MKFKVLIAVIAMAGLSAGSAIAVPIADITYIENDLGNGAWKYDYVFTNNSTTNNDLYDVYFLGFVNNSIFVPYSAPPGWDSFAIFGDFSSTDPVSDIVPNSMLGGFSLTFEYRVGNLPYVATFTNPDDPFSPLGFSGTSTLSGAANPVPEPGTMALLGAGLAGLIGYGRKRLNR